MAMLEEIAYDNEVYASALVREIVEVWLLENSNRSRSQERRERASIAENLRDELISLNSEIRSMVNRREKLRLKMEKAAREEGFGEAEVIRISDRVNRY
jgi:hypothetical protein